MIFQKKFKFPNNAEIISVEKSCKLKFPASFVNWIKKNGGGGLEDPLIVEEKNGDPVKIISYFFSIYQIEFEYKKHASVFPEAWIPIGISLGGDFFVINQISGNVLYVPVEKFYGKNSVCEKGADFIAPEFDVFLKLLHDLN